MSHGLLMHALLRQKVYRAVLLISCSCCNLWLRHETGSCLPLLKLSESFLKGQEMAGPETVSMIMLGAHRCTEAISEQLILTPGSLRLSELRQVVVSVAYVFGGMGQGIAAPCRQRGHDISLAALALEELAISMARSQNAAGSEHDAFQQQSMLGLGKAV